MPLIINGNGKPDFLSAKPRAANQEKRTKNAGIFNRRKKRAEGLNRCRKINSDKTFADFKIKSYLCNTRTPKPLNNAQIGGRFILYP